MDTALRHRAVVAGVDLAGDERQSGTAHRSAFVAAHAGGLAVTISTDGRTTSATTLAREFRLMSEQFGWTTEHETRCQQTPAPAAFR